MSDVELRPIPRAPNYLAGSDGILYSRRRWSRALLPLSPSASGLYLKSVLYVDGKKLSVDWHIVIAEAFHGICPDGQEVRHRDGNRRNNVPTNLLYGTRGQNMADKKEHGTAIDGERHSQAKLTWLDVAAIRAAPKVRGSGKALAERFGVSRSRITMIRQGKNWKRPEGQKECGI